MALIRRQLLCLCRHSTNNTLAMPVEHLLDDRRLRRHRDLLHIFKNHIDSVPAEDVIAELVHLREIFKRRSRLAPRQGLAGVVNHPHRIVNVSSASVMARDEDAVRYMRPDKSQRKPTGYTVVGRTNKTVQSAKQIRRHVLRIAYVRVVISQMILVRCYDK